jgi:hypothetical protein
MKMIMTEFRGKRAGFFRPKPVFRVGKQCRICGSDKHVGTTTCVVRTLSLDPDERKRQLAESNKEVE